MNCKIYQSEIEEGTSEALLSGEAHAHVNACRKCLGIYEERVVIRGLVGKLEKIEAPPDFEIRLRARLAASKSASRRAPRSAWYVPSLASIAFAACFVLTIAGTVFLQRPPATKTTAQLSSAPALAPPSLATNAGQKTLPASEVSGYKDSSTHAANVWKYNADRFYPRQMAGLSKIERIRPAAARKLSATESVELSLKGANVITKEGMSAGLTHAHNTAPISVQVHSASVEPLRVIWRDEQGNARPVLMKSVSFGAQSPGGLSLQSSSPARPISEGVW